MLEKLEKSCIKIELTKKAYLFQDAIFKKIAIEKKFNSEIPYNPSLYENMFVKNFL